MLDDSMRKAFQPNAEGGGRAVKKLPALAFH
jgi:hypothetical protein